MLYQEFKERTGYVCGLQEFETIHSEYIHSELNKDEWCRRWVRMNRERVDKNKARQAELKSALCVEGEAYVAWRRADDRMHCEMSVRNIEEAERCQREWERCEEEVKRCRRALYE